MPVVATSKSLARRRPSAARLALCCLAALGLGCTEKGRSLVLVDLSSAVAIDHVQVVVAQASSKVGEADAPWGASPQPLELGVYVPKTVTGSLDVIACGFDSTGATVAASPTDPASVTVTVQPGTATAHLPITLLPGTMPALCATLGGSGGAGGGGNGGASGPGGAGGTSSGGAGGTSSGGASGTGGTGAGGAGAGGSSGSGGGAGAGGAGGSGGAGAGGASGAGGRGAGGAGGVAGAGGRGGSGGTAGAGGKGGSGGAAGAGGSGGAGGAAGPSWRGPKAVAADSTISEWLPSVAVDPSGNAIIVYQHGNDIWFSKYTATTSMWGMPGPLEAQGGQALHASVAVDKNGNYVAVWAQAFDSALEGIYAATSSDGVIWSNVITITTANAGGPALSMNANGAAVVAWTQSSNGGNINTAAASIRSTSGGTWTPPQVMLAGDDNSDRDPVVAMSGTGQAFVGWQQDDGTDYLISLWMRQYTVAGGWAAANLFEHYNGSGAYGMAIAANTAGNAIATYIEVTTSNPSGVQLWSQRYNPTTGFGAPIEVAPGNNIDTIVPASVTLDESGIATVAWAFEMGTTFEVYTSRAGPSDATWQPAMEMETDNMATEDSTNLGGVTNPIVRNDAAGNVTLIWRKRTSGTRFDLASRRFTGGAWGPAALIETDNTNSVFWPALSVGTNGTAVATWYYDPALDVWANVFR